MTTMTSPPTNGRSTPTGGSSAGDQTSQGHGRFDTHSRAALAATSPPTKSAATPSACPSAGDTTSQSHDSRDIQNRDALAATSPPTTSRAARISLPSAGSTTSRDHMHVAAQRSGVPAATSPPATAESSPMCVASAGSTTSQGHAVRDTHIPAALAATSPPTEGLATPKLVPSARLTDGLLVHAAGMVDDLERTRMAADNRLRALRQDYGLGDIDLLIDAASGGDGLRLAEAEALSGDLAKLEKQAVRALEKIMRRHPLAPWVARTQGAGDKQTARLLAAIGDPYIRPPMTRPDGTVEAARPRLVSELWSYCGWGDAGRQVRRRGQKANWNADARMRVWLIANQCLIHQSKSGGPHRAVYDATREKYADAVHNAPCPRCGPAGRPAQPGSPLSLGHQHARALRAMCKQILRDLWLEARALHQGES